MAKRVKKYRVGQRSTLDIVIAVILGFMTLAAVFPFYQVVLLSFADMASYAKHPLYLLPYCFDLTGYKTIFEDPMFFTSLGVTLFITLVGTSLNMFLSVMGAYVLSRKYLMGRKVILNLIIFTMLFNGGLIPTYLVIKNLKLVNTVWAMILPCGISTYYLIIMKNYFMSLPDSLLEAARLDGCSPLRAFVSVMIPAVKTGIITIVVISFLNGWNDLVYSMTFNTSPNMRPLTANIYKFQSAYGTKWNCIMAYGTILVIPVVLMFIFLQKYIVGGLTAGAVKE